MSKSRNNGVDPKLLVEKYGADTARLFMMFTSPPEQTLEWSDEGVQGSFRFIRRVWRAVYEHVSAQTIDVQAAQQLRDPAIAAMLNAEQRQLRLAVHQTLTKVTDDIGRRRSFNTAIAAVMELLNTVGRFTDQSPQGRAVLQEAFEVIVISLSPMTPHVCHVLWHALGHDAALIDTAWPAIDGAALVQATMTLVVQVNGKLRGQITLAADADEASVRSTALADVQVMKFVGTAQPKKIVVVPRKLVNIVV